MQTYSDAVASAVAANGKGPLTPETIDKLRKAQTEVLDSRWEAKLENLRQRAPFRNLSLGEQHRTFLRLARLSQLAPRRKFSPPRPHFQPMPACSGNFHQIVTLGSGPFAFGSADTPYVASGNDPDSPGDGVTLNTIVEATFPHTGQIGLGAAVGGPGPLWTPFYSVFGFLGNRARASLTQGFYVPDLAKLAPGALTAACTVSLPSPQFGLVAGDPKGGDPTTMLVSVCGQATLDVVACNAFSKPGYGNFPSQSASQTQQLFNASGIGSKDNDSSNLFGENWDTTISGLDPAGDVPSTYMTASISLPLATSDYVLVTVSVEVSAWAEAPATSMALVDVTGQNTGLPILEIPGNSVFGPYGVDSAASTQPIQISDLRVCGI